MNEHDLNRFKHMRDQARIALSFAVGKSKGAFLQDQQMQYAIIHALQIVGEAASRVTKETQKKESAIPWSKIIGLRNVVVHGYTEVDNAQIWDTLVNSVPVLLIELDRILASPAP